MLRDEIIYLDNIVENVRNISYVTVASILTFAVTKDIALLYLISYAVIIPAYNITISKNNGKYKIAAYMIVYLEGEESGIYWERRNHNFFVKNEDMYGNVYGKIDLFGIGLSSLLQPYIFISLFCTAMYFFNVDYSKLCSIKTTGGMVIAILLQLWVLLITIRQEKRGDITQYFIEKWIRLKEQEENEQI